MNWIKLTLTGGTIGDSSKTDIVMVNMDAVALITEDKSRGGGSKLVMTYGAALAVAESPAKLEAIITGSLEKSYRAPEPKG